MVSSSRPRSCQLLQQALDTAVHVGDFRVVLGDDVVRVGTVGREPGVEIIPEGFKVIQVVQRVVFRVEFIALIEHLVKRLRGQIRGVGIHMP